MKLSPAQIAALRKMPPDTVSAIPTDGLKPNQMNSYLALMRRGLVQGLNLKHGLPAFVSITPAGLDALKEYENE